MGIIYSVACKECKVTRNLEKFYEHHRIKTRKDALKYADELERAGLFRAGLLISFLSEHKGHECIFFSEYDDCAREYDPFFSDDFQDDTDYFSEEEPKGEEK